MPATGPDFISLQARDLDASQAFYEQYLGLVRSQASARRRVRDDADRVRTPRGRSRHRSRVHRSARHRSRDLAPRHRRPGHSRCSRRRRSHHRLRTDRRPLRPDLHLRRPRRLPGHPPRPRLTPPIPEDRDCAPNSWWRHLPGRKLKPQPTDSRQVGRVAPERSTVPVLAQAARCWPPWRLRSRA
jgi:catechol 2,3-dioxygenase-like lactoylglutathione lyase family enzyme